jgi:hypothetical protein
VLDRQDLISAYVDEGRNKMINKMIRRNRATNIQSMRRGATSSMVSVGPDELKMVVRYLLAPMTTADRLAFILALEAELRSANVNMRSYLFLLGISATSPEDLTPGDIGHFVRFLKINVPSAMRAVDGVIERFSGFTAEITKSDNRIAA